jgi:hypothetical protein
LPVRICRAITNPLPGKPAEPKPKSKGLRLEGK